MLRIICDSKSINFSLISDLITAKKRFLKLLTDEYYYSPSILWKCSWWVQSDLLNIYIYISLAKYNDLPLQFFQHWFKKVNLHILFRLVKGYFFFLSRTSYSYTINIIQILSGILQMGLTYDIC